MSAISFIFLSFFMPSAMAASFDVPVGPSDRLVLTGFQAQVLLQSQPGTNLKISGVDSGSSEGNYILTRKNNVIEIKMVEFSGKKNWLGLLPRAATQLRKIEISGAPIATEIQLHGGSVVAQKWTKDLKVSMTQGRLSASQGAGALQGYVQKGDVSVQSHAGKVTVDSFSGTMALRDIQGDVDATLFSGTLAVENVRGFVALSTQQANSKVNQGTGSIQFDNGKGSLAIQGFQGRMEGQNQEGAITITMPLDAEVDVKTKSGRVSVQTPPSSGASLNLLSVEGEILTPKEVRVYRLSSERTARGKLRGDTQRGSVFVRSQDGTISVK